MRLNTINAREYGILPNQLECQKEQLERLFCEVNDGSTIFFEPGTYQMDCQFIIHGKKNLTICGNKTTFVSHYEPHMSNEETPGMFFFQNCENLTLCDLDFTTDTPANTTGHVVSKDIEGGTYVFRPLPEFTLTGTERIMAQNSFDEQLTPDYHLYCYKENKYELLENGDIRIQLTEEPKVQLERLQIGQLVCLRHTVYGKEYFMFENCKTVKLEDINVYGSPGSVTRILPHCEDFSFLRFNIKLPEGSKRLMASNADGIHVKGLSGNLSVKDCYFEHLGDDALNIHSRAAVVTEVNTEKKTISCVSGWRTEALYEKWAEQHDILEVYDSRDFLKKATVRVEKFENGCITYTNIDGNVHEGDVLANTAYFASVHVDNCVVRNSRARGFLLQSRNIVIENCVFYGISHAAILIAPDIDYWYEVGPAKNIVIRNNKIEKCAYAAVQDNLGTIVVKASHGVGYASYPCGVHKDIVIAENRFCKNPISAVFVSATDGVVIKGNEIKDCCMNSCKKQIPEVRYAVSLRNCSRVILENNNTNISEERFLLTKNCTTLEGE